MRSERELSGRRLSARRNTRYGAEAEDSINFDLTKDQEDLAALESPGRRLLSDPEHTLRPVVKSVVLTGSRQPMEIQAVVLPMVTLKSAFHGVNLKVESPMISLEPELSEVKHSNTIQV